MTLTPIDFKSEHWDPRPFHRAWYTLKRTMPDVPFKLQLAPTQPWAWWHEHVNQWLELD